MMEHAFSDSLQLETVHLNNTPNKVGIRTFAFPTP